MITGHLAHHEIHVTRARLQTNIHRVDPHGVTNRSMHAVKRRVYHVPFSNYVWHLHSHQKLIRWCIVIHASSYRWLFKKKYFAFAQITTELMVFYSVTHMLLPILAYPTGTHLSMG